MTSPSINIATRGYLSGESDLVSVAGRLFRQSFIWREIIYITYTTDAFNEEINLTSSLQKEIALESSIQEEINLTSSLQKEIALETSIQKEINLTATIITR